MILQTASERRWCLITTETTGGKHVSPASFDGEFIKLLLSCERDESGGDNVLHFSYD